MKIKHASRQALDIPFYCDRTTRAMHRANTHGERVYVYRLELDDGTVGYGDSTGRHEVAQLPGNNPFALLHDDSIGYGPQLALLDAVGKATGVPAHALMGTQVRKQCPFSWWAIDMPPEDWAAEARESVRRGYTCFKIKARPWRDIFEQVDYVSEHVPADYKFDVDFNGFLLNQARAETVLHALDKRPNVGMYESPLYAWKDPDGIRILREQVRNPVIEHYREELLRGQLVDGFVVGGCASQVRKIDALAAAANKPFWLQLVGTGITAAFAAHLGSVLAMAQLPYITCHGLWEHDLLKETLPVRDGYIEVPDGPGLGIEVDEDAIERLKADENAPCPRDQYRSRKRILRVSWPGDGGASRVWEFTDESVYQAEFYAGNLPGFQPGARLDVIEDDGSEGFQKAHEKLLAQGR